MAYEGQIAGVGDRPPGKPLMRLALPIMQALSARELAGRRAEIVDAVRSVAPLRFVNGGGTGSIERTAAEPAVTEVAAGSGLYGPTLFDTYRAFTPRPAALFALPVVRKPTAKIATALGGGYLASGAAGRDRLPRPFLPAGLKLDAREGAGEVQTPLLGRRPPRCASATASGSATPRRASCASASTSCTSCAAASSSTPSRPTAARARPSSKAGLSVVVVEAARRAGPSRARPCGRSRRRSCWSPGRPRSPARPWSRA